MPGMPAMRTNPAMRGMPAMHANPAMPVNPGMRTNPVMPAVCGNASNARHACHLSCVLGKQTAMRTLAVSEDLLRSIAQTFSRSIFADPIQALSLEFFSRIVGGVRLETWELWAE
jgi:hypothetical protein